jgi:hypothetical protein
MGFTIFNEKDRIIIKPTIFAGLLGQKVTIFKENILGEIKIEDIQKKKTFIFER